MTSAQFNKNSHVPCPGKLWVRGRYLDKEAVKADTLMVTPA
jgi:hypothetical protein